MRDPELDLVFGYLEELDPLGERFDRVIRGTFDQLYDGQRTGRYDPRDLYKTERTHCGTLIEINTHREFRFGNGAVLDYLIEGTEVDCKYSQTLGGWMIPPEALGHLCLVVTASDTRSLFWVGIVRVQPELLNEGRNRDQKRSLNVEGRRSIRWLHYERPLTENLLLQLSEEERYEIVARYPGRNGQRRINELFRRVQGRVITRTVVATVAQQDDYMKRVRGNGGARSHLREEGIVILGDYQAHQRVARDLGIVEPRAGGFVSVRLVPADEPGPAQTELDGRLWRVADPGDPVVEAPLLPDVRRGASE
ncbi:MAG TPA: NaeI family type II restriction endonuclease [Mycobacteriales bacterium]|jgi:hypothetical protein|nr:NaeI family type II restriction endonuclease [Mycobacteriales bacterium]